MNEDQYLSPEEVGKMFRATKWTVRRWVEAGRLPAVRLGRRLLIPAEAVKKLVEQQLSPGDLKERQYVTHAFARDPAVRYDYFMKSFREPELDELADVIMATLRVGGWPYDTVALKKDGIIKIILGEEKAPPAIWRYLRAGVEHLSALAPSEQNLEDINGTRE